MFLTKIFAYFLFLTNLVEDNGKGIATPPPTPNIINDIITSSGDDKLDQRQDYDLDTIRRLAEEHTRQVLEEAQHNIENTGKQLPADIDCKYIDYFFFLDLFQRLQDKVTVSDNNCNEGDTTKVVVQTR